MNINKIICTGRLTKDPELRQVSEEMKVCQLRLAVDGMGRGREVGYLNVAVFGKAGEAANQYLSKGWLVAVDGRLEYGEWESEGSEKPRLQRGGECRVPDRTQTGRGAGAGQDGPQEEGAGRCLIACAAHAFGCGPLRV
jgi:single-strand DNA-binding protein